MVAMDFFEASNFYDFFNQYCLNLLKNPTVRGLSGTLTLSLSVLTFLPTLSGDDILSIEAW